MSFELYPRTTQPRRLLEVRRRLHVLLVLLLAVGSGLGLLGHTQLEISKTTIQCAMGLSYVMAMSLSEPLQYALIPRCKKVWPTGHAGKEYQIHGQVSKLRQHYEQKRRCHDDRRTNGRTLKEQENGLHRFRSRSGADVVLCFAQTRIILVTVYVGLCGFSSVVP